MTAGIKPKPTALKKLKGNPGKRSMYRIPLIKLNKLKLEPGDILCLKFNNKLPAVSELEHLVNSIKKLIPLDVQVFAYASEDLEISVAREVKTDEPGQLDQ